MIWRLLGISDQHFMILALWSYKTSDRLFYIMRFSTAMEKLIELSDEKFGVSWRIQNVFVESKMIPAREYSLCNWWMQKGNSVIYWLNENQSKSACLEYTVDRKLSIPLLFRSVRLTYKYVRCIKIFRDYFPIGNRDLFSIFMGGKLKLLALKPSSTKIEL